LLFEPVQLLVSRLLDPYAALLIEIKSRMQKGQELLNSFPQLVLLQPHIASS
jgi:hypothetical protein